MKEVGRLLSVKQLMTTPYHPTCTGIVERLNGTLKKMLCRMCAEQPKQWDRYLPALLFALRETPHNSLDFSPFELLYGRTVRGPMAVLRELMTSEQVQPEIKNTYQYVIDLKDRLKETCSQESWYEASSRYKKLYDRKAKPRSLRVGDKILILRPTDQNKPMQWKGPFSVVGVKGNNDYIVDLKGKTRTYCINLLKQYHERNQSQICHGLLEIGECVDIEISQVNHIIGNISRSDSRILGNIGSDDDEFEPIEFPSVKQKENISQVNANPDLSRSQKEELQSVLSLYNDTFTNFPKKTRATECEIKLATAEPIHSKPYPIPQALQEIVELEVNDMLTLGVIERCEFPYAHPIVMVKKKDNTFRFCIDFRKLNKITVFNPEPMPNPDKLFTRLSTSKFFSKIDLTKGYWQIPLSEESKNLTAFVTPEAHIHVDLESCPLD